MMENLLILNALKNLRLMVTDEYLLNFNNALIISYRKFLEMDEKSLIALLKALLVKKRTKNKFEFLSYDVRQALLASGYFSLNVYRDDWNNSFKLKSILHKMETSNNYTLRNFMLQIESLNDDKSKSLSVIRRLKFEKMRTEALEKFKVILSNVIAKNEDKLERLKIYINYLKYSEKDKLIVLMDLFDQFKGSTKFTIFQSSINFSLNAIKSNELFIKSDTFDEVANRIEFALAIFKRIEKRKMLNKYSSSMRSSESNLSFQWNSLCEKAESDYDYFFKSSNFETHCCHLPKNRSCNFSVGFQSMSALLCQFYQHFNEKTNNLILYMKGFYDLLDNQDVHVMTFLTQNGEGRLYELNSLNETEFASILVKHDGTAVLQTYYQRRNKVTRKENFNMVYDQLLLNQKF